MSNYNVKTLIHFNMQQHRFLLLCNIINQPVELVTRITHLWPESWSRKTNSCLTHLLMYLNFQDMHFQFGNEWVFLLVILENVVQPVIQKRVAGSWFRFIADLLVISCGSWGGSCPSGLSTGEWMWGHSHYFSLF